MNNITYTINIGQKEQQPLFDWRISPSILKKIERNSTIDTLVDFSPFSTESIPELDIQTNEIEKKENRITPKSFSKRIVLSTSEGIHLIDVSKIIRLEADKNYTEVFIENQKSILISQTLKEVEKQLDPKIFIRIHQSHTVSIMNIDIYHRGRGGSVTLRNGDLLPVSKNKKEALLELLF